MQLTSQGFNEQLDKLAPAHQPVPMGKIFALAKQFVGMPLADIEALLRSPLHACRVGAVSIMDFEARDKKTTPERKKAIYELYIDNHAYIDTWDLVDRAAPYVVGGYLFDKPRDILYTLAGSAEPMERRTAITATYYFIRQNDLNDTFKIAGLLATDPDELVQKAVGGWVREAGKREPQKLITFLDTHASAMPRTMLTYAVEKLPAEQKQYYRNLK